MSRIPAHTVEDAPEQSQLLLERMKKSTGRLMNIHAGMAHSPIVLATYGAINEAAAEHGTFDARTREAIALAVGAVDDCGYCQAAHTISGQRAGLILDETIAIRAGLDSVDPKLAALLAVMRAAADNVGEVDDQTWDEAVAAGWTDTELTEAFAYLVANLMTNYFNHYARTDLDLPEAPSTT